MSHFDMSETRDEDDSSDSEHKHKRRKTNSMRQSMQNGASRGDSAPSSAAPNSFAAKMMAKMGYVEGQGLGASGKGRLAPIDAQQRPQGAGLGAVKEKTKQAREEEKREAAFRGEVLEDSSDEEKRRRRKLKERRLNGKTSGPSTPAAKPKQRYKTSREMEAEVQGLEIPNVLKSIIDATGPQSKLLTSSAGLMSSQISVVPSETESMKIARRARRDVEAFSDELGGLNERESYFKAEEDQLLGEIGNDENEVRVTEEILKVVEQLQESTTSSEDLGSKLLWDSILERLESIEQLILNMDESALLQEIAVAATSPLFNSAMQNWNPLEEPTIVVSHLERLRPILEIISDSTSDEIALLNGESVSKPQRKSTKPYETMIYKLWLPRVRSSISNDWDVYNPDPLVALVKAWRPVLPPFVLANVIDQLVVRRLTDAVTAWKPRGSHKHRRHTQPQAWLFPWLEFLDEQHTDLKSSTGLLSDVKRKLKTILSTWEIYKGVLPGIEDWRSVFKADLSTMLVRYILPRLALHLSENLIVDPSDQDLTPLDEVLSWTPYFKLDTMSELFVAEFFPKWHQTLHLWLTSESPSLSEISEWFQWWKQELGERLPGINEQPPIVAEWDRAVETLNNAMNALDEGLDIATHLPPPATGPALPIPPPTLAPDTPTPKPLAAETIATFKDVVEDWCAENDLHMIPLREADLQTGLPLFRITASASGKGGVVVYLKGDVVWGRGGAVAGAEGRAFLPMGLDEGLVARAEGR